MIQLTRLCDRRDSSPDFRHVMHDEVRGKLETCIPAMLFPEKLHSSRDPLFQRYLWLPAQYLLSFGAIEVRQVDIAGAFRRAHDFRLIASDFCQRIVQLVY